MNDQQNLEFNLDVAFSRLEEINRILENPQTTLKDSLSLYQEGVKLAAECRSNLDCVEKEIKVLNEIQGA